MQLKTALSQTKCLQNTKAFDRQFNVIFLDQQMLQRWTGIPNGGVGTDKGTGVISYYTHFQFSAKVISRLLWFCIATLYNCLKISRHFLNQSEVKPNRIVTCLHAFSRAMYLLPALIGSLSCLPLW